MSYDVKYFSGFDYNSADIAKIDVDVLNGNVSLASPGRSGSGSQIRFQVGGGTGYVEKAVSLGSEFVIGFGLNMVATGNANTYLVRTLEGPTGATEHLTLRISSGGPPYDLLVYRGGTLLTTVSLALAGSTWHHIQFAGKIHDTTGYWYLYVNDSLVGSATGIDTRNGGTAGQCDYLHIGMAASPTGLPDIRMDDFYAAAVTSGPEHPGDLRASRQLPQNEGNSSDFTPSAGTNNAANVDDGTVDDNTTYNESATVGHKDLYTMDDVPNNATIICVKQQVRHRKTDAGTRSIRTLVRSGGSDYEGSTVAESDSYVTTTEYRMTDPATSAAWDPVDFNNVETGIKVQA